MRRISVLPFAVCSVLLALAPGVSKGEAPVKSLVIPAAAANGDSQSSDYSYNVGVGRFLDQTGEGCYMAPALLPHGGATTTVTVIEFVAYAIDNGAGVITYKFWRKELSNTNTDQPELMGAVTTTGSSTNIQILRDDSIDNPVVTSEHTYYITWCWPATEQAIQAFQIYYTES